MFYLAFADYCSANLDRVNARLPAYWRNSLISSLVLVLVVGALVVRIPLESHTEEEAKRIGYSKKWQYGVLAYGVATDVVPGRENAVNEEINRPRQMFAVGIVVTATTFWFYYNRRRPSVSDLDYGGD